MTNPSNLYAEKIFSEHPLVLWALDDQADYISIISESQRNLASGWNITNTTASAYLDSLGQPFENSHTTLFTSNVPLNNTTITAISPNIINFNSLNLSLKTFTIGTFLYTLSPYLQSVSIGYEYTDTTSSLIVQKLKTFEASVLEDWYMISETFEIPNEVTDMRIVIKMNIIPGGATSNDYKIYLNGLTFGQWCEEFNATSLGVTPISFPTNIALNQSLAIEAKAYGLQSNSGYYLANAESLCAKNTSIPIVYGASNITKILPNNNKPSLIVPGKGFLNKVGQYNDYTVEFWAKINSDAIEAKRIFGPIASTDGLYVESGFLTLVIGTKFASYFVGEWYRPMLIHVRISKNIASVLINGEEVISLTIDTASLELPDEFNNSKSQDWLGFYAYENILNLDIDCVAIYPYQVASLVAKRRFAYGQAVAASENIDAGFNGSSAFIDYPFADYTANYKYPDLARWDQGTFDNLVATTTALTTPNYKLPEIFLSDKTLKNLYLQNKVIQNQDHNFITFRPHASWAQTHCYFNFPKFNLLNDQIHSIFATIQINEEFPTTETLFYIENTITGNYFSVRKHESTIDYYLYYNGEEQEFYSSSDYLIGDKIAVGIHIEKLVNYFGGNIAAFFGNQNGLKMYFGGDYNPAHTFTGNIYNISIATSFNTTKIVDHFNSNGIAKLSSGPELTDHIASYTLLPLQKYSTYFLDIGVNGYWEDYMPLSYFGQFVSNSNGEQYYDLDFLQFNLGYPEPVKSTATESIQSWTYQQLKDQYSNPVQITYNELDNYLYTGWEDYSQLAHKTISYREFNTTDAMIRSYITLQYIKDGSNALQDYFGTIVPPYEDGIIDIDNYSNWNTTKFEVVNNTLIYPTKTVDFEKLSLVAHLEFKIKGILSKPVELKKLEISSQALSNNNFTTVGTRFGIDMYPYTKSGFYYDYKTKNPFSIYKGSTPYLYLTRDSGIEVRGNFMPETERGISIPINKSLALNYKISAMQMWMKYDKDQFTFADTPMFNINYKNDIVDFYFVANNSAGTRAKIYVKTRSTGQDFNGLSYYINGALVREPVISIKEWTAFGIGFGSTLVFDSYLGSINLTSPFVFNNISYYKATSLQQVQSRVDRPWLRVKQTYLDNLNWQYWLNNYTWNGVLIVKTTNIYGINPSTVYSAYLGTNKIIIDDNDGILVNPEKIQLYSDLTWQRNLKDPV